MTSRYRRIARVLSRLILMIMLGSIPVRGLAGTAVADESVREQGVLQAWEQEQKSDPKTLVFERTAPRTYHLKTSRFPYDGTVRLDSIVVHEMPAGGGRPANDLAVVEPTLDQPNSVYQSQYPESFGDWQGRNYFYYDADQQAWLTAEEYRRKLGTTRTSRRWLDPYLGAYVLIASLLLLIVGLVAQRFREWRLVKKRFKEASTVEQRLLQSAATAQESAERQQRLLALNEEQTQLLREILEQLKRER